MTNQEKWDEIVSKIEELGEQLHELYESTENPSDECEQSLFGLRSSVDELMVQDLN